LQLDQSNTIAMDFIYVNINIGVFRNSPCSIIQYHKHG
jgi:hypothetical protein